MNNKIGIIGGTFNPIHNAHLLIAEQFYDQMGLANCYFVPSFISPFKINNSNNSEQIVSPDDRLEMVNLALGNNPHFLIDKFELDRKCISYTINTVHYFKEKFPNSELFFLIGQDQANYFIKWQKWQKIIEIAQLVIAKRVDDLKFPTRQRDKITEELSINGKKPLWISNTNMEISSSEIRKKIIAGKSTNYLLPDAVYDYIKNNNLYR